MASDDESSGSFRREALAADARELVGALETLHVDPFVGYESRTALHIQLERLLRRLPDSATGEEFYRLAAPLVADLQDTHSRLHPPDDDDKGQTGRYPFSFRVIGDGLYVKSVMDDRFNELLGTRLLGVDGTSVETLIDRMRSFRGTENSYGSRLWLRWGLPTPTTVMRLLDRSEPPERLEFRFETTDGERTVTVAPAPEADREPAASAPTTMAHPEGTGPRYRLYEDGSAAVFSPGDLRWYREAFEIGREMDWEGLRERAERAYERHIGDDPTEDVDAIISGLPSMVETLHELTGEMADAGTETLIVDLRDLPGGDSHYIGYIAHAIGGWELFVDSHRLDRTIKRRTDQHRDRFGEEELGTAEANLADYDLKEFFPPESDGAYEQQLENRAGRSETFADLRGSDRETIYDPEQIIVVTSAGTMSSAFAGAAKLAALGADVVGVPSGQAPRSFGEPVERELANTGLTISISSAMFDWIPDTDGAVLDVDRELTPARFASYDRAADAGLRLAFDHAGVTNGEPPVPIDHPTD